MEQDNTSFISTPGFCSDCGSILPLLSDRGNVNCYACKRSWGPEGMRLKVKLLIIFQIHLLCVRNWTYGIKRLQRIVFK